MPERPTEREQFVLALFESGDPVDEGLIGDECWPFIRRPRTVVNGLVAKALVRLGAWIDDEHGYELLLTTTEEAPDA